MNEILEKIMPEKYLTMLIAGWDGIGVVDVAEKMLVSGCSQKEVETFLTESLGDL